MGGEVFLFVGTIYIYQPNRNLCFIRALKVGTGTSDDFMHS